MARARHAVACLVVAVLTTTEVVPRVEAFSGGLKVAVTRPHDCSMAGSTAASAVSPRSYRNNPAGNAIRTEPCQAASWLSCSSTRTKVNHDRKKSRALCVSAAASRVWLLHTCEIEGTSQWLVAHTDAARVHMFPPTSKSNATPLIGREILGPLRSARRERATVRQCSSTSSCRNPDANQRCWPRLAVTFTYNSIVYIMLHTFTAV